MRGLRVLGLVAIVIVPSALVAQPPAGQRGGAPAGPGLTLTTSAFPDGGEIPAKYTQSSQMPVSPKLEWTNVPANTVSFVLHMRDPDVARMRTTEDMLHWLVFNIPGSSRGLPEDVPTAPQLGDGSVQTKNGGGTVGYRGPGAPAAGPHHHYTWELYALDTKLELTPDATRADVMKAIDGHILGKGVLVGRFHR
jgi:Raf kinase inhibitor-like YbhB/YbcL family protein